jgi:hypothetical protein
VFDSPLVWQHHGSRFGNVFACHICLKSNISYQLEMKSVHGPHPPLLRRFLQPNSVPALTRRRGHGQTKEQSFPSKLSVARHDFINNVSLMVWIDQIQEHAVEESLSFPPAVGRSCSCTEDCGLRIFLQKAQLT